MDLLLNAEFVNFSEREILEKAGRDNHLGKGVKRLLFKRVVCTKSFFDDNGKEIYRKGQEYKLWIAEYTDSLLGIARWFTATPTVVDKQTAKNPICTYYMVPREVFQNAGHTIEKAPFILLQNDYGLSRYQLFIDVNDDNMQKLIPAWVLDKSEVLKTVCAELNFEPADCSISGRFLSNAKERHIVWMIGHRRKKQCKEYFFFDVLTEKLISWDIYNPESTMAPISSGQAKIHVGDNMVEANKYGFIYTLGKKN